VLDSAPGGFQLLEGGVMQITSFSCSETSRSISAMRAADRRFRIAAEGHLPFKNLVDELLHHVLAAFLGNGVLAKAPLGDNLIQQRYLSGLGSAAFAANGFAGLLMFVPLWLAAHLGAQLVQFFGL
jgi:hypothetical protein